MTDYFNLPSDVISLGLGEPGVPTPECIGAGGIRAIQTGQTGYAPSSGYPALREEICRYLEQRFGLRYTEGEVLLTVGASLGIDCIMRAILNEGEEVVVPTPAYGYYASIIAMSGGRMVCAATSEKDGWKLRPEVLSRMITSQTKAILLNYPNNPTGAVMDADTLAALAAVIRRTQAVVISDEVYAELAFDGAHHSLLSQPGMRERSFLVSGFSKSMAMTGWRIGYVCAPAAMLEPVARIHASGVLCTSGIAQAAVLEGLRHGTHTVDVLRERFRENRAYVMKRIEKLGWACALPGGAFYIWPDIRSTGLDAEMFALRLMREGKVAVVPGTVFGEEYRNRLRISYASPIEVLKEAFDRIEGFCARIR